MHGFSLSLIKVGKGPWVQMEQPLILSQGVPDREQRREELA